MNRGQGNDKINDIMKLNEYIEITNKDNMELMKRYPDKYLSLVACELDKDYFESSIQRVKAALQTQSLF